MSHLWFYIALVAEIAWAVGIYLDKYLVTTTNAEGNEENTTGTLMIISSSFGVVVAFVIFIVMTILFGHTETFSLLAIAPSNLVWSLFIGVLEMLWLIPYFYALHYTDEMIAPPILQTVPVFGFILGFFFFNEIPTVIHGIASALIVLGALFLNIDLIKEESGGAKVTINWKAILLMLLSSIIIAAISFIFKDVAIEESFWGTAFWTAIGSFCFAIFLWLCIPSYRIQFNKLIRVRGASIVGINVTNEIIDNIAIYAFNAAVIIAPSVVLVQSTTAYQPLLLLAIGFVLAKLGIERHAKTLTTWELTKRVFAIGLITVGSLLIFI